MLEMAHAVLRAGSPAMTQVVMVPTLGKLPTNEENCFTLHVERKTDFGNETEPFRSRKTYANQQQQDRALRVLTVDTPRARVTVSHDMAVRAQTARRLAFNTILPVIAVAPLLLLCVGWGVSHALRPMGRIRREIGERAAADLRPLSTEGVPEEALPFVREINTLFSRITTEFEARQNFVADVAHELRSPLAALKLQVELLCRSRTPESQALAHGRVMAGIARATRLVEQLLTLAREGASQQAMTAVPLPQIARLAISDTLAAATARDIDLGAALQDGLPESSFTVSGNAEALRTLLRNLLDNAVKYTPTGGVVTISLQREAASILLTVEDSGPGIPAAQQERFFERFQRGSNDTAGSGLGLAIVRAIAERHGIGLRLDTSTLGGLAVLLRFPCLPAGDTAAGQQAE
ncbi:ATP-binding protein [Candidatus Dactylopiibacterium carminicum]|nr:ATP-binding protein [Candidatus Dactylopiibacterium carminicum]